MTHIFLSVRTYRYLTAVVGFCLLGVLFGVVVASRKERRQQRVEPIVATQTKAVQVTGTDKRALGTDVLLVVNLQNVSTKDIKALTLSAGNKWVTKNFLFSEESFARGATFKYVIPLSSNTDNLSNSFSDNAEFTIAAVLFADGNVDGDSRYAKMLVEKHAGIRDQAKRVLSKIHRLNGSDQDEAFAELEVEANALPTKGDAPTSPDYEEGLQDARRILVEHLRDIRELRKSNLAEAATRQEKLRRVFESLAEFTAN